MLRLEPLSQANFADYEALTEHGDDGKICYCSFWHLKCDSPGKFDALKQESPLALREIVRHRMLGGFHVGALAYEGATLAAWISVAPLPEIYWAWKRAAAVGPQAATTAAITCLVVAEAFRGRGLQRELAERLCAYGRERGWTAIEAYPFDEAAATAKPELAFPGFEAPYRAAGFSRVEEHWLSRPPDYPRSIWRATLG